MTDKTKNQKKRPKREFTKQVVAAVLLTYFLGVIIGAVVVLRRAPDQLSAFLAYIGAPTATTVGFYCWKAKAENISKNKKMQIEPPEINLQNTEEAQG